MDTKRLLHLLAERLGTHTEVAEQGLNDLVRHLNAQLHQGQAAELPGLGVLQPDDDGITFVPDERLATLVNHQFSDLPHLVIEPSGTVEAMAPSVLLGDGADTEATLEEVDEAPPPAEPSQEDIVDTEEADLIEEPAPDEEDVIAEATDGEEVAAESSMFEEWSPETFDRSLNGTSDDETLPPDSGFTEISLDDDEADEPLAEPVDISDDTLPTVAPVLADEPIATPETEEVPADTAPETALTPAPAPTKRPETVLATEDRDGGSGWMWLLGVLAIALIATLAYFFWPRDDAATPPVAQQEQPTPPVTETPPNDPPPADDPAQTTTDDPTVITDETPTDEGPVDTPPADEPNDPVAATDEPVQADPPPVEDNGDPLRSEAPINVSRGGVTIVVGSSVDLAAADDLAARFRAMGFRTGVLTDTSGDPTRHRVGVGQFDSVNDALNVLDNPPDAFPGDAWVYRIR